MKAEQNTSTHSKLSSSEKLMLADLLNSQLYMHPPLQSLCNMASDWPMEKGPMPTVTRTTDGKITIEGFIIVNGLEHAILDGCNLEFLETKWSIDGVALIEKLRTMTFAERVLLLSGIEAAWERCRDGAFEATLEALPV